MAESDDELDSILARIIRPSPQGYESMTRPIADNHVEAKGSSAKMPEMFNISSIRVGVSSDMKYQGALERPDDAVEQVHLQGFEGSLVADLQINTQKLQIENTALRQEIESLKLRLDESNQKICASEDLRVDFTSLTERLDLIRYVVFPGHCTRI